MTEHKIDWKAEAAKRKEDFLSDLFDLLKIDSVRDDDKATADAPVGPGPKEALEAFLKIGDRDGFVTKNVDNWAGHIEYGDGDELMGVLAHVDVVPTGTGWDTDPFEPVIKDGRLYARGSSDDKGPGVAAYYAIKMIKELDLPVSKKVRFIIGTDEESEWKGIKHYLETEPEPDFGFSPDATFPIINGEKGNTTVFIETQADGSGADNELVQFESGLRANMVPQDAVAVVQSSQPEVIQGALDSFLNGLPVKGVAAVDGNRVTLEFTGQAAHGSKPASGVNAATYLARFLSDFSFGKDAKAFLEIIALYLHDDPEGKKMGVDHVDAVMGELTSNPGVFSYKAGESGKITVNMRYPQGTTEDEIFSTFEKKLSQYAVTLSRSEGKEPHYVPANDPLVTTLLDVYHRQTGLEAHEMVIGGGTYGRLMERGVAYGAMFPDSVDTMHQANEFMAVDDLMNAMAIYAEAIYELIK
ncbi:Acetylornithine deacetylase [Alkalibacterium sp. AK22]|uniref:dipeptidase PepV n=1 Tax=Alkalibacterium sp. AK22 TaxID=1229520 RepID=UPI0004471DEE|nr:dipeptidase PepV [Alkalibacterium sp. AK22]EXJ23088.1 Acetylornithine deacetylase [Alkalibacterium sp. AK22]